MTNRPLNVRYRDPVVHLTVGLQTMLVCITTVLHTPDIQATDFPRARFLALLKGLQSSGESGSRQQ